jgi:hypothetical protein
MSTLQFTLFFTALLIGYVLLHLRLVKFEAYLKEISVLKLLNERLSSVADAMERIRIDSVEEGLHQLHEDAKELSTTASRIESSLSGLRGQGDEGARMLVPGGQTAAERVCAVIEERLFQLGFKKPRILTDLRNVHIEDEIEVQVECERQMMPYKGKVKTKNGAILDVDVHSVVSMFP